MCITTVPLRAMRKFSMDIPGWLLLGGVFMSKLSHCSAVVITCLMTSRRREGAPDSELTATMAGLVAETMPIP